MIAWVENSVNEQNTKCEEYDSCHINYLSESAKVKSDSFDEQEHFQKEKVLNNSLYAPQIITFDPCLRVFLEPISLSNITDLGVQEWHSLQTVYYAGWSQCESLEW